MKILPNIYGWFESLYSSKLADYLWGFDCETGLFSGKLVSNSIGLIALSISLAFVIIYYYAINHPRFNRWWSWLIMFLSSSTINFFIGYAITFRDFSNGSIGDCLMFIKDENGQIISKLINESDCWMFGVTNFIVSALFFIALTFILKWGSRNSKYSPFVKF